VLRSLRCLWAISNGSVVKIADSPLTNIGRASQYLVVFLNNLPSIAAHVAAESLTQGLVQNNVGVEPLSNTSWLAIIKRVSKAELTPQS
jgi:hypothetical protein